MPNPPEFKYRDQYLQGINCVFTQFQPPTKEVQTLLTHVLLARNTSTLIKGPCGTGKTRLVQTIAQTLFFNSELNEPDFGQVSCSQDKTPSDVIYRHHLGELMKGNEIVSPRRLVTRRLKFINEVTRANHMTFNELLSLLSEYQVKFRDLVFSSPDFVCLMDANPNDAGSSKIPQAFMDRIDFAISIPTASFGGIVNLFDVIDSTNGLEWDLQGDSIQSALTAQQMEEIWKDVARVAVPLKIRLFCALISSYFQQCIKADRSKITSDFQLGCHDCQYRSEACAKLTEVPGIRYIKSLVKLAQAKAWIRGESEIAVEDILYGLPYTLGHRLKVKEELVKLYENPEEWIKRDLYPASIRSKVPRWLQAIDAYHGVEGKDNVDELTAMRDLAIDEMLKTAPVLKN